MAPLGGAEAPASHSLAPPMQRTDVTSATLFGCSYNSHRCHKTQIFEITTLKNRYLFLLQLSAQLLRPPPTLLQLVVGLLQELLLLLRLGQQVHAAHNHLLLQGGQLLQQQVVLLSTGGGVGGGPLLKGSYFTTR